MPAILSKAKAGSKDSDYYDLDVLADVFANHAYINPNEGSETQTNVRLRSYLTDYFKLVTHFVDLIVNDTHEKKGSVRSDPFLLARDEFKRYLYILQTRALSAIKSNFSPSPTDIAAQLGPEGLRKNSTLLSKAAVQLLADHRPKKVSHMGIDEIFVESPLLPETVDIIRQIGEAATYDAAMALYCGLTNQLKFVDTFLMRLYTRAPLIPAADVGRLTIFQSGTLYCHDAATPRCSSSAVPIPRDSLIPAIYTGAEANENRWLRNPYHKGVSLMCDTFNKVTTTHPSFTSMPKALVKVMNSRLATTCRSIRQIDQNADDDFTSFDSAPYANAFAASVNAPRATNLANGISEHAKREMDTFQSYFKTDFIDVAVPTTASMSSTDMISTDTYPSILSSFNSKLTRSPTMSDLRLAQPPAGQGADHQFADFQAALESCFPHEYDFNAQMQRDVDFHYLRAAVPVGRTINSRGLQNYFLVRKLSSEGTCQYTSTDRTELITNLMDHTSCLNTDEAYSRMTISKASLLSSMSQETYASNRLILANVGGTFSVTNNQVDLEPLPDSGETFYPQNDPITGCPAPIAPTLEAATLFQGNAFSQLVIEHELFCASGAHYAEALSFYDVITTASNIQRLNRSEPIVHSGFIAFPISFTTKGLKYAHDFAPFVPVPFRIPADSKSIKSESTHSKE